MHQLITEDTRHRNESSPSLDLLFTKDPSSIEQLRYLAPIGASDHDGIDFQLPYIKDSQIIKSQKILYNKGNYDKLRSILHNTDWDLLFQQGAGDIQTVYDSFEGILYNAIRKCVPIVQVSNKTKLKKCG